MIGTGSKLRPACDGLSLKNLIFLFLILTEAVFPAIIPFVAASVAHLVERHLAKVEVASSSLVTRSMRSIIKGSEKVC